MESAAHKKCLLQRYTEEMLHETNSIMKIIVK